MPASDRHQQPLRLPRETAEWVRRQAARRKIPVNTFVQLVLEEKREAMQGKEDRGEDRRKEPAPPRGLGLRPVERRAPKEPPPLEAAAPVVVNVGGGASASPGGDLIPGLAAYVASGPTFDRDRRRRLVLEVLRAGKSRAEQEQLVQQLDAALAEQQPTARALGAIGSLFR